MHFKSEVKLKVTLHVSMSHADTRTYMHLMRVDTCTEIIYVHVSTCVFDIHVNVHSEINGWCMLLVAICLAMAAVHVGSMFVHYGGLPRKGLVVHVASLSSSSKPRPIRQRAL